ncbi:MAG: hypothetical protein V7K95_30760 [Nostoc sp.]
MTQHPQSTFNPSFFCNH